MKSIKSFLKVLMPPIILQIFRKALASNRYPAVKGKLVTWHGDFESWKSAMAICTGYDDNIILESCKTALLQVKEGRAKYERDSIVYNEIRYSWGLLSGLLTAALNNKGALCVLDFGGSLGSTWYQNRYFLKDLTKIEWCIVEQPHFVDCGRQNFQDQYLKFYYTIEECLKLHQPTVLLFSSVLQYLDNPEQWIKDTILLNIDYIIIDRTSFTDHENDMITVQRISEKIYKSSYPAWFFNESKFLKRFTNYECIGSFDSFCDPDYQLVESNVRGTWKGFILKRIN